MPSQSLSETLTSFDNEVRKKESVLATAYQTEKCRGVNRVTGPTADKWLNWIDYYDFALEDAMSAIQEQIDYFDSIGHGFRWKIYSHDPLHAEVAELLIDSGFEPGDQSSVMIIETERCSKLETPTGIEYVKLTSPENLAVELEPITSNVWEGAEDLMVALTDELRDMGDHIAIYAAKESGKTVGAGLVRFDQDFKFGGLFAGATVPGARGRGVYRGIVGRRAKDALALGVEHLYIEAGPMSRPIAESIGFQEVSQITNYVRKPSQA